MADTVKEIVTDIQSMLAALTGVNYAPAPASYPDALNSAQLPTVLTWPGEGEWTMQAMDLSRQNRIWQVNVYVTAVAEDRGIGGQMVKLVDLLQDIGETFVAEKENASPLGGYVEQIGDMTDSGLVVLTYAGKDYRGFVFTIETVNKPI